MESLEQEVHKICLWPLPIKADAFCSSQCRYCCWLVLEDDFLSRDNWHMIINSKDSFLCGRSRNFLKLPGQSLLYYYSLMWKKMWHIFHLALRVYNSFLIFFCKTRAGLSPLTRKSIRTFNIINLVTCPIFFCIILYF